jgi:hypothetical protein
VPENMRSTKRLRSVVHSVAHHAMSGLSYLHPHLGELCQSLKIRRIEVNLLNAALDPAPHKIPKPLALSLPTFCRTFESILASEKLDTSAVSCASALFEFHRGSWPNACLVTVITPEGRRIESAVGLDGAKSEVIHHAGT